METMNFIDEINNYLTSLKIVIDSLDRNEISKFIDIMLHAYQNDKNIYIFGNGGSASTASHFTCDINKGFDYELTKRFRVINLTENTATIMALANDITYEDIFIEQLKNYLRSGDLVIGISGSGNSKNVLKAVDYANKNGNITVGITGYNGGILKNIAYHCVNANVNDMQLSEDVHLILTHIAMKLLYKALESKEKSAIIS